MGKSLFITEKPSVAMEFIKLLQVKGNKSDGYIESNKAIFTWCVGHMVTMCYPEEYDAALKKWSLKTLPFLPKEYKYEVIQAVSKQFSIVKKLLTRKDVDIIYVCTDSGREGEYIYRLVDKMVGVKDKEKRRVWIDSQTEEEIKRGIKEAKLLSKYDSLADAAYLRAKEDYLQGINFSRLLTLIYGKAIASIIGEQKIVIAVGRVMSCVLGMIVDREREIRNFKKTLFYRIVGNFKIDDKFSYNGEWKSVEDSKYYNSNKLYNESGFKNKEDAQNLIDMLNENKEAVVYDITKTNEKKNAPLLFNLAELQSECSKIFKINPDETLNIIQLLYEKKMLTYPRTDARVLSKAVSKEIHKNVKKINTHINNTDLKEISGNIIKNKWYDNLEKTKYVNDKKITDHYAIIPTGEGIENYDKLKPLARKIYELVMRRFLAIFYPPAKFSKISITTKIGKESFFTSDKVCTESGYLKVLKPEDNKEEKNDLSFLRELKKGTKICNKDFNLKEGETAPPKRYTSGSMILAMENAGKLIEDEELREHIKSSGIGTSATRAEILKKLDRIEYIKINNKTQVLQPSTKGEMIYEVIKESIPSLLNPVLTASWEKGLKMVVDKEIKSDIFMEKLEEYIKHNVNKVLNNNTVIESQKLFSEIIKANDIKIDKSTQDDFLGICPFCKNGQIVKNSKGYGCNNWKNGCNFFIGEICGVKISPSEIKNLIKYGRTNIITGFKSKKGEVFNTKLILKDNKIRFM